MTEARSSSTQLPPVRRVRRRDWVRLVCRVLTVVLAVVGLVPVALGLLVRTSWARGHATRETQAIAAKLGIDAKYDVELRLWPLSVAVNNLRVEASDGGDTPFLTARRVSAKPKIFGLLAGKLTIDQIEIDRPKARVILKDGKLANLGLDLPKSEKKSEPMTRPPFNVISVSDAEIDLTIDEAHVTAREIDADVTTEDDGYEGAAFELALRVAEARAKLKRSFENTTGKPKVRGGDETNTPVPELAWDDDTLCRLDARARVELPSKTSAGRLLVRRLTAHGAADMDAAADTFLGCDLSKADTRYVEIGLGHVAVTLPKKEGDIPNVEGHVKLRAPLQLIHRLGPDGPMMGGWASVDAELRYTPETPIPDVTGQLEVHDIRVARFNFAKTVTSEIAVRHGVVSVPVLKLDIAGSATEIRGVEVRPLEKGIPIKVASVEVQNANFTKLLADFHVHPRPFVEWDIRSVSVKDVKGTGDPVHLDGDLTGHTYDFAVNDRSVIDPTHHRIIGVRDAALAGKLQIRPRFLEFANMTVTTPKSVVSGVLVAIGYHDELRIEVPSGKIEIGEISPIGSVVMGGLLEPKDLSVVGDVGSPMLKGDATIKDFVIGDIPFGNVTQAHVESDISNLTVDIKDAHAQKGKSLYEMSTGRLDFRKPANMRLDGQVSSKSLNVRDFFSMFKLDEDPRFAEIDGNVETNARIHLALGGPEDQCNGGYLTVSASTNARDLNLLGERFDEGHADFEYRWVDRLAGIDGAEIDVRSLSLTKVKKEGRASLGSILGSLSVRRGGDLRGNLVVQGYPLARVDLMGPSAKLIEGNASGVARLGGKLSAFDIVADVNVTPIRVMGAPFAASDLHVQATQKPSTSAVVGHSPCGAPIAAPFNKEAYLKDTSSQGEYKIGGALFGGQVRISDVVVTRQKAPIITGKVNLDRFDLGPIGKIITSATATDDGTTPQPLGGEISGDVALERIPTGDLPHAKVTFVPKSLRLNRGGQRIDLHSGDIPRITLADDTLTIPKVTFNLATPNGLKGSFAVNGDVKKVTRSAEMNLAAELFPIDLGIMVGVVPKVTRAMGTLSGAVKITGSPSEPDLDGRMSVRGGEFGVKGLPSGISDVEIDVEADENEARITRAFGHFLGGEVSATARMPLKGGQLGVASATVTGRQLFVTPVDGVRATVDADLEVTVNPNATSAQGRLPFVGGEVTITQFDYTRPVTIDLTGFRGGAKRTVVEAYDPSADSIVFGFDVRSRTPLHIRNNLVDAKLVIDSRGLHVTGTNQRIGLRGDLATMPGGRFRVFANDFEVQKGSIRFEDPTRIVPHVDITGITEYRRYTNTVTSSSSSSGSNTTGGAGTTSGNISSGGRGGGLWRIALHAFGDTEDLHVDMTSDPALSREDIFFLLTIGLTRAEVDQVRAGSVYASAAFEAIGTVSGADRAVKTAIPVIDDFRFGSAYSPRTGRTEPQVTLGRRLTDNVRANVSTGLTEDRQLRSNVEWRLSRPLSVQTSYDNISTVSSGSVGNFGLDFRWRIEFD